MIKPTDPTESAIPTNLDLILHFIPAKWTDAYEPNIDPQTRTVKSTVLSSPTNSFGTANAKICDLTAGRCPKEARNAYRRTMPFELLLSP
ncbi:MAG: hypothetical protein KA956_15150 [Pyrinomonadaceae bacterium]|nr:hypothetical protein [Acidobacteriota bacterium]MBK7933742.1 hypothetical protein [Acidobacteriota bacterium]MBP7377803.1 hypothetical protein [Pyrinomonadaceae bacterium]